MTDGRMTNRQVLEKGKDCLRRAALSEGEWDAWLLFSAAYGMDRKEYLMQADEETDPEGYRRYQGYLKERMERRPTAYIVGSWGFMGLDFYVDERVLIPRQDTEVLAEEAVTGMHGRSGRVLDLCTGSGCLAVSIAALTRDTEVWAADISEGALTVAERNAERNRVDVHFCRGDLFDALPDTLAESFTMILSNPPYVTEEEYRTLEAEVTRYEPKLALTADHEGLRFYERIAEEACRWLQPGGLLGLEIGAEQGRAVAELLQRSGYEAIEVHPDLNGLDRVVWCRRSRTE